MKLKKRFFALALAALSVFSLMAPDSAANGSYSGISFTNGVSRRFLFSDSPEAIRSSNSTNGYLAGTTFTAGERMDFELYHHNNTGMTKRFGIVVQNGNNTAATLTLHNKAIGTASSASQQSEQQMTAPRQPHINQIRTLRGEPDAALCAMTCLGSEQQEPGIGR